MTERPSDPKQPGGVDDPEFGQTDDPAAAEFVERSISGAYGDTYSPAGLAIVPPDASSGLSPRQREALWHWSMGCTDREVCERLGMDWGIIGAWKVGALAPYFQKAAAQSLAHAGMLVAQQAPEAVRCLAGMLRAPEMKHRLRAAELILSYARVMAPRAPEDAAVPVERDPDRLLRAINDVVDEARKGGR